MSTDPNPRSIEQLGRRLHALTVHQQTITRPQVFHQSPLRLDGYTRVGARYQWVFEGDVARGAATNESLTLGQIYFLQQEAQAEPNQ